MKNIIFPGSFDLFHNGHLQILNKALELNKDVIIIVANNCRKKHTHSLEYRQKFIENYLIFNNINNVKVIINDEKYLADYMKKNNIKEYIRGIRNWKDLLYEKILLKKYQKRYSEIKNIIFRSDKKYKKISSSKINKKNKKY